MLEADMFKLFRLGELVEQRICRRNIHRFLIRRYERREGGGRKQSVRYAFHTQQPGDLAPPGRWSSRVDLRLIELGYRDVSVEEFVARGAQGDPSGRRREYAELIQKLLLVIENGKAQIENESGRDSTKSAGRPSNPNDERDSWFYQQCITEVPYKSIIAELARKTKEFHWGKVGTPQGVRAAVERYRTRKGLKEPPPRRGKK